MSDLTSSTAPSSRTAPEGNALAPPDGGYMARILEALPDAIFCFDRSWTITYANREAIRLSRLDSERLATQEFWQLYPELLGTDLERRYRAAMASGEPDAFEFHHQSSDIWVEIHIMPAGEGISVCCRDISERKRSELRESEAARRLAQVLELTSDGVFTLDREWRYTFINESAQQMVYKDMSILGRNIWEVFPWAVGGPSWIIYHRSMNEGLSGQVVAPMPGGLSWLSIHSQPAPDGIVVFFRDITEQRNHERVVRAQQELLQSVQRIARIATWEFNPANGVIDWGQGAFEIYGHPFAEVATLAQLEAILLPGHAERMRQQIGDAEPGKSFTIQYAVRGRGGEILWIESRGTVFTAADQTLRLRGVAIDVTERHLAQQEILAEQIETERRRAELETIYATSPVGLSLLDPVNLVFLNMNDQEAEMIGAPKDVLIGRPLSDIAPPETMPQLYDLMRTAAAGIPVRNFLLEGELAPRPGERRAWSVNYAPIWNEDGTVRAISTASLEVTNQKKAEAALIQSEKLAAVGRLASSISHEINNPLEAITNLLYLIAISEQLPEELKLYIQMAQSELARVSQIATQTLRFHRQAVAPTRVTPAQLVEAVIRLYTGRLANSRIRVEAQYRTETQVLCFENDIRQVLNNLIANAIDAMRTGGRLIVRAHDAYLGPFTRPRRGIRITIADTGHGMSPTVLARVFEAFFTTKDLNGTGLGLWISAGIVDRHQGRIRVRSSAGAGRTGTVFTLFLPCEELPAAGA